MTSNDPVPDDSAAHLAELFFQLSKRIRTRSAEHLAPLGLTPAQARALRMIARSDVPLRIVALAAQLDIVPRSATTVVDALEQAGLVTRQPDPADRRSVLLTLTEAGRARLTQLQDTRRQTAENLFQALDPHDRAHLSRILDTLTQATTPPGCPKPNQDTR
ncbi:MAG TPA: MarR family transcriptional regulator [Actinocatenispora sp.]